MFLITTALENTWNKNERWLFLGEWCKKYDLKDIWENNDSRVLDYHWDDRSKLYDDYLYINTLYEKCLASLANKLNEIHGVSYSKRYWRIIIGPWLKYFLEIIFDRFFSILKAGTAGNISDTWILDSNPENWVPEDFYEFTQWIPTDQYNHFLYSEIIKFENKIKYSVLDKKNYPPIIKSHNSTGKFKQFIKYILFKFSPPSLGKIAFGNLLLNNTDSLRITAKLRQLTPRIHFNNFQSQSSIDMQMRNNINCFVGNDEFSKFLQFFLPLQIPKAYLENYFNIHNYIGKYILPRLEAILSFSADDFNYNECFKFWMAASGENGTKICLGQHGGHFGIGKWSSAESHQMDISDVYYTWGWKKDHKHCQIKPISSPPLQYFRNRVYADKDGYILWVVYAAPRYSYWMYSVPVAAQYLDYFKSQCKFASLLRKECLKDTKLRLYHKGDYGWQQEKRWLDTQLKVNFSEKNQSIIEQINCSRLVIATYNSTTYLECLAANFPIIVFWDMNCWEIREEAEPYFEILRSAGIFHDTPESAANMLNSVYANIHTWWGNKNLQSARETFVSQYANTDNNWLSALGNEFKTLKNTS